MTIPRRSSRLIAERIDMDRIPMTKEGYAKLKAEVEHLEGVEMPKIAEKIAAARAEGDLKENAEYHGARESQGMLQAKINFKKDRLARAEIIDPSNINKEVVGILAKVTVEDVLDGEEETYWLVGAGDEDYDQGKIMVTSPIGKGLVGKKVGEIAEFEVPRGTCRLKVVSIEYEID
jgi:transcription elongation factor GreA